MNVPVAIPVENFEKSSDELEVKVKGSASASGSKPRSKPNQTEPKPRSKPNQIEPNRFKWWAQVFKIYPSGILELESSVTFAIPYPISLQQQLIKPPIQL